MYDKPCVDKFQSDFINFEICKPIKKSVTKKRLGEFHFERVIVCDSAEGNKQVEVGKREPKEKLVVEGKESKREGSSFSVVASHAKHRVLHRADEQVEFLNEPALSKTVYGTSRPKQSNNREAADIIQWVQKECIDFGKGVYEGNGEYGFEWVESGQEWGSIDY